MERKIFALLMLLVFCMGYSFVYPLLWGSIGPYMIQLIEAPVFAVVILLALRETDMIRWLECICYSAVLNLLLIFLISPLLEWPETFLVSMGVGKSVRSVVRFGIIAATGALVFSGILRLVLKLPFLNAKFFLMTAAGCFFSGLPFLLPPEYGPQGFSGGIEPHGFSGEVVLGLHKALWFLIYGTGLILAASEHQRVSGLQSS